MPLYQIGLISLTDQIPASDLSATAAAIQKQVSRDLSSIWGIHATVDSFPDMDSLPVGYWPVTISETIDQPDDLGYHWNYANNQPYAVVLYEADGSWQLTCSHEVCEMLVDPYGQRSIVSDSIADGQGRVNYLVEACDPCEDPSFGYSVNGILLSDFYTPNYFDPIQNSSVRYSFTGAVTAPKQVLAGGYLTWFDPASSRWFQATYFNNAFQIADITTQMQGTTLGPMRSRVDRITKNPNKKQSFAGSIAQFAQAKPLLAQSAKAYQKNFTDEFISLGVI